MISVLQRPRGLLLAGVFLTLATFERSVHSAPTPIDIDVAAASQSTNQKTTSAFSTPDKQNSSALPTSNDLIVATQEFRAAPYIARAKDLGLAKRKTWLRLGHWRKGIFNSYKSEADGRGFFLSKQGKDNPGAELEETLRSFFAAPTTDHAICKFPARYLWLNKNLAFDAKSIPKVDCAKFRDYFQFLAPNSATVVFSSYYLGSPSSAFGHTLLRINKKSVLGGRQELLDTGINYSASTDTDNGVVYAFKGLTGLFPGHFARMPYYYKVREYGDYEARDIWEYKLNLTGEQLNMLVAHIWELGSTYFDYFYLSENCSYHLLAALEVAAPNLNLLNELKYPVLPADTIKVVTETEGLVEKVSYRPSLRSQFKKRVANMPGNERKLVRALASDSSVRLPKALPVNLRGQLLDAAADLVDLENPADVVSRKSSAPSKRRQQLLTRRAELRSSSPAMTFVAKKSLMPHRAHGSRRFSAGGGFASRGGAYADLGFRLTLHDLADPPAGYLELSAIEILPTTVRVSSDAGEGWDRLSLRKASLIRFTHLNPVNRFQQKLSYDAELGFSRTANNCNCGFFGLRFGPGFTLADETEALSIYGVLDTSLGFAPDLNDTLKKFRFGAGPKVGLRLRITDRLVGVSTFRMNYFPRQIESLEWRASSTLRWQFTKNYSIDANGFVQPGNWESGIALHRYY